MRGREDFTPARCRAGRGLLSWTTAQLATAARLDLRAIEKYEAGGGLFSAADRIMLAKAFNDVGVIAVRLSWAAEGVALVRPPALATAMQAPCDSETVPLLNRESIRHAVRQLVERVAAHLTRWPFERSVNVR